ncbi:NAD(P)-binding domain-containing protein [Komagataeibacter sp. FNDCF1]|uniref:NAD(P)-binding domain-containing protein n=1 Tax=Komagataeibacter sp. FNDCF1 TaxID=2878681 RepID=UPI001E60E3E4|nr:NAD(P)-binding domain-containing protein [Komagataeibacter sp. FNDCF1]MCE2565729.1 NAD(P)-binding domain-containing protein [Komagataeibacter sp. FNDCF1]
MNTDIAIIGAGPYGLSLAAHLRDRGVDFRIFGRPMAFWRDHVPSKLCLKAEGFALDLFDPKRQSTLRQFCAERGHPYAPTGVPIPARVFTEYGEEFQKTHVPHLQPHNVTHLSRTQDGFILRLENGKSVVARNVVMAIGIGDFANVPPPVRTLPPERVSHTFAQTDFARFAGQRVAVIGAGSSAVDTASFLHEAGAEPVICTRRPKIWINHPPRKIPLLKLLLTRIKKPRSGLGTGWRSRMASDLPDVFHMLPARLRLRITRGHLGPAAGWVTGQVVRDNKVPICLNLDLRRASMRGQAIHLEFADTEQGTMREMDVDHVFLGTGVHIDLARIPFLDRALVASIRTEDNMPALSRNFESSVPGLHFIGPLAAGSFGPLLRFAWGARFAARRLSGRFRRQAAGAWTRSQPQSRPQPALAQ